MTLKLKKMEHAMECTNLILYKSLFGWLLIGLGRTMPGKCMYVIQLNWKWIETLGWDKIKVQNTYMKIGLFSFTRNYIMEKNTHQIFNLNILHYIFKESQPTQTSPIASIYFFVETTATKLVELPPLKKFSKESKSHVYNRKLNMYFNNNND